MYVTMVTGEQMIREISKRQSLHEVTEDFPGGFERRRAARLRGLHEPVDCRITTPSGDKLKSAFVNFSDTGALLRGPLPIDMQQDIEIFVSFADTGETFALRARVVRLQGEHLGAAFI